MHRFIENFGVRSGLILCLLVSNTTAMSAVQNCKKTSIVASTPTAEFIDNNDGTLTHSLTGLMWKRCAEGQAWDATGKTCTGTGSKLIWRLALQHVASINVSGGFAGHTDWRLPNIKELLSIVENQCAVPAINQLLFPALPPTLEFWTGTPSASLPDKAWVVQFNSGLSSDLFLKSRPYSIRLVRNAP